MADSNPNNKHDSNITRFFSQFDLLGRLFGGDKFIQRQADTANKDLFKVIQKDPFIRADRQHGLGSTGGLFGDVSDWAYNHPADATGAVAGAVAGGLAGAGAGAGGGAGSGAAAGAGGASLAPVTTTVAPITSATLPTVTVAGSAGGAGGAAGAAGAAGAGAGATSTSNNGGRDWSKIARQFGGQLQQQGQQQDEAMLEMLARQGPPPQVGNSSTVGVGPQITEQYKDLLTPQGQNQSIGQLLLG